MENGEQVFEFVVVLFKVSGFTYLASRVCTVQAFTPRKRWQKYQTPSVGRQERRCFQTRQDGEGNQSKAVGYDYRGGAMRPGPSVIVRIDTACFLWGSLTRLASTAEAHGLSGLENAKRGVTDSVSPRKISLTPESRTGIDIWPGTPRGLTIG